MSNVSANKMPRNHVPRRSAETGTAAARPNSPGGNAATHIYVKEGLLTGTGSLAATTVRWRGKLAADGNSYTASGSTGCAVYAWRAG